MLFSAVVIYPFFNWIFEKQLRRIVRSLNYLPSSMYIIMRGTTRRRKLRSFLSLDTYADWKTRSYKLNRVFFFRVLQRFTGCSLSVSCRCTHILVVILYTTFSRPHSSVVRRRAASRPTSRSALSDVCRWHSILPVQNCSYALVSIYHSRCKFIFTSLNSRYSFLENATL